MSRLRSVALAAAISVSGCSSVIDGPEQIGEGIPAAQTSPSNGTWEPYVPSGRTAGSATVTWTAPAPAKPEASPRPATASVQATVVRPVAASAKDEVVSRWADAQVPGSLRTDFDEAVREAASVGAATLDEAGTGNRYSLVRQASQSGCVTVEVTVLSPGGTLPVLSRGLATAC